MKPTTTTEIITQDLHGKTLIECQGNIHGARDWNFYSINDIILHYNSLGIHQFYMSLLSYITADSV